MQGRRAGEAAVGVPGAASSVWRANGGFKQVNTGEEAFAQAGLTPGCGSRLARGSVRTARPGQGVRKGSTRDALGLGIQPRAPTNPAGPMS